MKVKVIAEAQQDEIGMPVLGQKAPDFEAAKRKEPYSEAAKRKEPYSEAAKRKEPYSEAAKRKEPYSNIIFNELSKIEKIFG